MTHWLGEYYNNETLSGSPALTRNDVDINFEWYEISPDPVIYPDHFSVRWTRTLPFSGGRYRFHVFHDDGARLWIDGDLVNNEWHWGRETHTTDVDLVNGQHGIKLEMYEIDGWAAAMLWWESLSTPTPTSTLTATPTSTSPPTPTPTSTRSILRIHLPLILKNHPEAMPTLTPTATPPPEGQPNLSTSTKTVTRPTAQPGESLLYTIVLNNTGTATTNVSLTDAIPPHTTYVSGSITGGAVYNAALDQIEWAETVHVGVPAAITFQVVVNAETPAGTVIVNAVVVDDSVNPPFARTAATIVTGSSH